MTQPKILHIIFGLLVCILCTPAAFGHALSCTGPNGKIYFTDNQSKANKCKYQIKDEYMCHFNDASNCTWDGGYYPEAEATAKPPQPEAQAETQPKPEPESAPPLAQIIAAEQANPEQTPATDPMESTNTDPPYVYFTPSTPPGPSLEDAKKEAILAAEQVENLKATMEAIKVNNENNAILYRSPDADLFSVDNKFNALGSKVTGLNPNNREKSGQLKKDGSRGLASSMGKKLGDRTAVVTDGTAASDKTESKSESDNTATSDNPWVNYMSQTNKAALIDRLRKNPGLLDALRDRISELQTKGDQSGIIELMEEALAEASREDQPPLLENLLPMSLTEAFSMDSAETEAQIRSLLADLDTPSDPQFLPQESLFQRVTVAHRRSVLRGSLKRQ